MKYIMYSHRYAKEIFEVNEKFATLWNEIQEALNHITDEDIIKEFECEKREAKSISEAINKLIKRELEYRGWQAESPIFADKDYVDNKGTWRLDFAKDDIAIEVAFNHGGNVSWNLIKPVLSSELNHVSKAIQTKAGILITATDEMKKAGGFDGAIGTYEKYVEYLKPLNNILTTPLLIIGLKKPETFHINVQTMDKKKIGTVVLHDVKPE